MNDSIAANARRVLQIEGEAIARLGARFVDDSPAARALETAVNTILDCSGRVVVTGLEKAARSGVKSLRLWLRRNARVVCSRDRSASRRFGNGHVGRCAFSDFLFGSLRRTFIAFARRARSKRPVIALTGPRSIVSRRAFRRGSGNAN
jgi:hypothetical protein